MRKIIFLFFLLFSVTAYTQITVSINQIIKKVNLPAGVTSFDSAGVCRGFFVKAGYTAVLSKDNIEVKIYKGTTLYTGSLITLRNYSTLGCAMHIAGNKITSACLTTSGNTATIITVSKINELYYLSCSSHATAKRLLQRSVSTSIAANAIKRE
jgi:hypothetical protein